MAEESTREFLARVPHLSASSVNDFLACPMLWAGRRLFKWPEPQSPALAIGTAVHLALAAFHKGKDAELVLLEAWKKVRPVGPAAGTLERALEALTIYSARASINADFDVTETFLKAPIPGVPLPFVGYLDLLAADNVIHEWKTGDAKYWSQKRVDSELQITAYWWLHVQQAGAPPSRIVLHAMNTARLPVAVTSYETTRTPEQLNGFIETCQAVYGRMVAQDIAPRCREGRCRFPEQCAAWKAKHGQSPALELV